MKSFNTPILFLIFNRPETTEEVFETIRSIQPKYLYIAADGPRNSVQGEVELCKKTRSIVENVDWKCEVKLLFREENLGCGLAVSSAIDWFFEHVEEGIILEDDCLPSRTFFQYCSQLLEHYRYDTRIGQISGYNVGKVNKNELPFDYFYSKYGVIWGWATWRRAWKLYDFQMNILSDNYFKDELKNYYRFRNTYNIKMNAFKAIKEGTLDTWDYQWGLTKIIHNLYSVVPKNNLVENIGFNEQATHTHKGASESKMEMTIKEHPSYIITHEVYDFHFDHPYTFAEWKGMIKKNIKTVLNISK